MEGRAQFLPHIRVLLGIHGACMALLGLIYCAAVPFYLAEGEDLGAIVIMGCLGSATPLIGALQLVSSHGLARGRYRRLAIASAALGWYASCISICVPVSLLLAIFVPFVLVDPEVKQRFE